MSNPLYATLLSFSLLFFCLSWETNALLKKDENQLVVGNIPSGKSQEEGSVECEEEGSGTGCKEGGGKGDMDERVFEGEDYIYTNSNP